MISMLKKRCSPIGVDVSRRSVRLLQMDADRGAVVQMARWDLPQLADGGDEKKWDQMVSGAIKQAYQSHRFQGREAVLCLGGEQLFVQNIRVSKSRDADLTTVIQQEAAGKVPFPINEAEIRFLEAADIRQGDTTRREVILFACHRPELERYLACIVAAGLRPVAVDVEPSALLRCYSWQHRRDHDREQRVMYIHVGSTNSSVVVAQGSNILFVKYLDVGGALMDDAVARGLGMESDAATVLRLHNSERRRDQQDPEVSAGVSQALRPVLDQFANEILLCVRYHSVTFRGQALARVVFSGSDATEEMATQLGQRLNLQCELGNPLRAQTDGKPERVVQWDIAAGLALREVT